MALKIRKPSQAGRFYDADAAALRAEVEAMIAGAQPPPPPGPVMALVAPHAGYRYSGPTAGWAYRLAAGAAPRRVVLLAPSHYAPFPGIAIVEGEAFDTPLGRIPADAAMIAALRSAVGHAFPDPGPEEHALEVQLPFLQCALGPFALTPLLVGDQSSAVCRSVAESLAEALRAQGAVLGADTLLVASSDLYHGHSAAECEHSDARLAETLEACDPELFLRRIHQREFMACGAGPIAIALEAARRLGAVSARVLRRTNSQREFPSDSSYTVGYLAAAVFGAPPEVPPQ